MRMIFLVLAIVCVNIVHADTKDYYKDVAAGAILADLQYHNTYYECLTSSKNQENCTEDGTHRDDVYIKRLDFIRTELLNKYQMLYPSAKINLKSESINQSRVKFNETAVLFQRKLLAFIGAVRNRCGTPDSNKNLNALSSWYSEYFNISNSLENEKILKEYNGTIENILVKNGASCKKYLETNEKIYSEAFGNQIEFAKKNMQKKFYYRYL